MLRFMQRRIVPYIAITVCTATVVFSGMSAKAKGDAVYSLSAGVAEDTKIEDVDPEILDLAVGAGVSLHVRTDIPTEEEI